MDQVNEEWFWGFAEVFGIPSTLSFETAKAELIDRLFATFDERLTAIESKGVNPFAVFPYCVAAELAMLTMSNLIGADTPRDAGEAVKGAGDLLRALDGDVVASGMDERSTSKKLSSQPNCQEFVDTMRDTKGMSPIKR